MTPSDIALSHGQARWVLWHMMYEHQGEMEGAFDAYLKYLRRHGVPFRADELAGQAGVNAVYRYEHLMELALALALKRQGVLKVNVVELIARCRDELRPLFPRAWAERDSGMGRRVEVPVEGAEPFGVSGVWLRLYFHYVGDGLVSIMGPIELMGPAEALREMSAHGRQLFFREPIRISELAERIVELAPRAPTIRRGRP